MIKGRPPWISCDENLQWWHGKCVSLTGELCLISKNKKLLYFCPNCVVSKLNGTKNFSNFKVVSESGLNLVESSNQPKEEINEHTHAGSLSWQSRLSKGRERW